MVFRNWPKDSDEQVTEEKYDTEICINFGAPDHHFVSPSRSDCWCTIGMLKELKRSDALLRKVIEKLTADNGGITPNWLLDLVP